MNSNTIICLSFAILLLLISSSSGMNVHHNDNGSFEVTHQTANGFLHSTSDDNSSKLFDKRESGSNCVPCKFGINPCCEPNICVKKTLLPDECQEIKTAKSNL